MTQSGQRQINLGCFLETITLGASLCYTLGTSQINHVKFTGTDMLLAISTNFRALNANLEQRVRTTTLLVHIGRANRAVFHTNLEHIVDLRDVLDGEVRKIADVDTRVRLLVQVEPVLRVFGQQIANFFVVDFQVACSDEELSLLGVTLNSLEDVLETTRHDTLLDRVRLLTRHGMRLTRACLTVRKDGSIVTLQHILDDVGGTFVVNVHLLDCPVEDGVKGELLGCFVTAGLADEHFTLLGVHVDDALMALLHFLRR